MLSFWVIITAYYTVIPFSQSVKCIHESALPFFPLNFDIWKDMLIPWKYQKIINFSGENQMIISNRSHPDASKNPTTNFNSLSKYCFPEIVFWRHASSNCEILRSFHDLWLLIILNALCLNYFKTPFAHGDCCVMQYQIPYFNHMPKTPHPFSFCLSQSLNTWMNSSAF